MAIGGIVGKFLGKKKADADTLEFPVEGGGKMTVTRGDQSDVDWEKLRQKAIKQSFASPEELKKKDTSDEAVSPDKQDEAVFVDPVNGGKPVKVSRKGLSSADWAKWVAKSSEQNKAREDELRFLHGFINDPSELDEVDVGPVDDAVTGKFKVNPNDRTYSQRGGRIIRSKANAIQRAAEIERELKERGRPLPNLDEQASVAEEDELQQQLAGTVRKKGDPSGGGMASGGGGFLAGVRRQVAGAVPGASPGTAEMSREESAQQPGEAESRARAAAKAAPSGGPSPALGDVARVAGGVALMPFDPSGPLSAIASGGTNWHGGVAQGLMQEGARGVGEAVAPVVAGAQKALGQVGDVLFPRARADARARDAAAAAPQGQPPAPAAPYYVAAPGGPTQAPPGGAVSASASVKTKGPGGTGAPGSPEAQLAESLKLAKAGVDAEAEMLTKQAEGRAQVLQDSIRANEEAQANMQQRRERINAEVDHVMKSVQQIDEEIRKVNTTVDPRRIWNEKSTGGKVLAGIGMALAGLGDGRGMKVIQQAIDNDIQAQKDSITGKMGQLGKLRSGAMETVTMLRQRGLDDFEVDKALRVLANQNVVQQIQLFAEKFPTAKANADKAVAAFMASSAAEADKMRFHRESLAIQREEARAKRTAAQAGKAGVTLKDQAREQLGGMKAASDMVTKLQNAFGSGSASQLVTDKIGGALGPGPGFPGSHAADFNTLRDEFERTIILLVDQSVINKHDAEQWITKLPKAGDIHGAKKLADLRKAIQMKLNATLESHARGGADVSGYQSWYQPDDIQEEGSW